MRLTQQRLRKLTLVRQFPRIRRPPLGYGRAALLELISRIGPLQSQVPRAPFLTAASRLPGIGYDVVRSALAEHHLLKTTNLRGTVHTSTLEQFGWLDAVSRPVRRRALERHFGLTAAQADDLVAAVEAFTTDDWQERSAVVEHAREWLREHGSATSADALGTTMTDSLVWGHSGLIRRPRDARWEKRTDVWHRRAWSLTGPGLTEPSFDDAVSELTRVHLSSFGPASVTDIAWWMGLPLTPVRAALAGLGDEVRDFEGPDGRTLVDLVGAPTSGPDPGLRLLAEFDSLLLGYEQGSRDRFIDRGDVDKVWNKANGIYTPAVLHGGRLVGRWKTVAARGGRTDIVVEPFAARHGLSESVLADPASDVATVLELDVAAVRLAAPLS